MNTVFVAALVIATATFIFTRPAPVVPTGDFGLPMSAAESNKSTATAPAMLNSTRPFREPRRFDFEPVWNDVAAVQNLPLSVSENSLVSTAGSPSSHIAVDGTIYELATGHAHGLFDVTRARATAVSPDGNWFAIATTGTNGEFGILLHPARNGSLPPVRLGLDVSAERLGVMMFLPDNRLLVQSKLVVGSKVSLWETSGTKAGEFETSSFESDSCALSPDGTQFALVSALSVDVYEIETGSRVAMMAAVETGFPTSMCSGLAYSPDGLELAALLHMDRFVVWRVEGGEVQLEHTLAERVTEQKTFDAGVQWLPDGSGWLLNGSILLLSDPVCVVWKAEPARARGYVVDQNNILVRDQTAAGAVLAPIALPWDEIGRLKEVLRSPLLGPGREISVRLESKSQDPNAETVLTDALEARCEAVGFLVTTDASVRLIMEYSERPVTRTLLAGDESLDEKDQVVRSTELMCRLRLEHRASGTTLWSRDLRTDGGPPPLGVTTAKALHIRAIESLLVQIENLNLPSYVPDRSVHELPLIHDGASNGEEAG